MTVAIKGNVVILVCDVGRGSRRWVARKIVQGDLMAEVREKEWCCW